MITVTLYFREPCPACDQAVVDLQSLQELVPHQLVKIDVDQDKALAEKYDHHLPVVEVGPYHLNAPFNRQDLQILLSAARDRVSQLEKVDQEAYRQRVEKAHTSSSSDRLSSWIANHYLAFINILILVYVGLPFLAPVLMKAGSTVPANIIYKIYSPMCHQLAFRSWFLFGEQAFYPRALSGITGVITYEEIQNTNDIDLLSARNFIGTEVVGYKVALCERDVAIYGAMLLFGLVFWVTGRKMRSVPWFLWIILGLGPIGLDGFSQLPGLIQGLPSWFPLRESNPVLRTLTGGLFGWMTAWYLIPLFEETARETRRMLQRKMAVIRQSGNAERR